jgi:hypothetical protein
MSSTEYRLWKILNDSCVNGLSYIIVKAFIFLERGRNICSYCLCINHVAFTNKRDLPKEKQIYEEKKR